MEFVFWAIYSNLCYKLLLFSFIFWPSWYLFVISQQQLTKQYNNSFIHYAQCLNNKIMTNICMHSSHYKGITMVHPLLGYIHKDLALGSFIMAVLQFSRLALTTLLRWVRSLWGELDHTRIPGLWSNHRDIPFLFFLDHLLYKNSTSNQNHYIETISNL